MKFYPSIDYKPRKGVHIYAFDKLDGSNIRAEWSKKKGFWKFGRRNGLLDDSNPFLLEAPKLIQEGFEESLNRIFTQQRLQTAIAFFEFHGANSFAGNHVAGEPHFCTLIDVIADKRDILEPKQFIKLFDEVPHAKLLYQGPFNSDLEESVSSGKLEGMTFEGIVCKGTYISPGLPLMFKVKSQAWYDKLRDHCKGDTALFELLR